MKHKKVAAIPASGPGGVPRTGSVRELGTELEPATQRQLDRGARMVELLKQPQYQPMDVIDQVMVIYAGSQGYLDAIPQGQVAQWEKDFLEYVNTAAADLKRAVAEEGTERGVGGKLVEVIKKFNAITQIGKKAAAVA